jgi:hypothetical protein
VTGPTDQTPDHVGIERRPTAGDPPHRIGEHAQVTDLLLEQVANPLRTVGDQVERVTILEKLGQHQYADLWLGRADLQRRPEPVIGAVWWHLDVGHYDVGLVGTHLVDQLPRVGRRRNDLKPTVLENMHDSLPDDGLVLAHHHAHPSRRIHVPTLCKQYRWH